MTDYKIGDEVYFTAFLKAESSIFFICRGLVERIPGEKKTYKVRITAVGDRPVGGEIVVQQATLLGRSIVKKYHELSKECSVFMQPPSWIELKPGKGNSLKKEQGILYVKNNLLG